MVGKQIRFEWFKGRKDMMEHVLDMTEHVLDMTEHV
jgi:hypothetical protein